MTTKFVPAPEVKTIAEDLIPKYHPHLADSRIEYVFIDTIPNKGGKEVWGSMRKITNLPAYLGADESDKERGINTPFFVLSITEPVWKDLSDKERIALVDHELCHGGVEVTEEGDYKLGIIPHDLEEFSCIVERHGLWRKDVEQFFKAGKQKQGKKEMVVNQEEE